MPRLLAVADEPEEVLWSPAVRDVGADVIVACGDLPADYLEYLVSLTDVPLLYVPGNHDPEGFSPPGCESVDGRVVSAAGLRIGGVGGSLRYRPGPNQFSEREMARRARHLVRAAGGDGLDVFVSHAPPAGLGDEPEDPAHRGVPAFLGVLDRARPRVMVHGHVAPYGPRPPDLRRDGTVIVNAVPHRVMEVPA